MSNRIKGVVIIFALCLAIGQGTTNYAKSETADGTAKHSCSLGDKSIIDGAGNTIYMDGDKLQISGPQMVAGNPPHVFLTGKVVAIVVRSATSDDKKFASKGVYIWRQPENKKFDDVVAEALNQSTYLCDLE